MLYLLILIISFLYIFIKSLIDFQFTGINSLFFSLRINILLLFFQIHKMLIITYILSFVFLLLNFILNLDFLIFKEIINNFYFSTQTFCMENDEDRSELTSLIGDVSRLRNNTDRPITDINEYINAVSQCNDLRTRLYIESVRSVHGSLTLNYLPTWLNFKATIISSNNPKFVLENFQQVSDSILNLNSENLSTLKKTTSSIINPEPSDFHALKSILKVNITNTEQILYDYKQEPFSDKLIIQYLNHYNNNELNFLDNIFERFNTKKVLPVEIRDLMKKQLFNPKIFDLYKLKNIFLLNIENFLNIYKENYNLMVDFSSGRLPYNSNSLNFNKEILPFSTNSNTLILENILKYENLNK